MFPIVYLQDSLKLILKLFHIESFWAAHQRESLKSNAFGFWLSYWMLFERFVSNSYSCQALTCQRCVMLSKATLKPEKKPSNFPQHVCWFLRIFSRDQVFLCWDFSLIMLFFYFFFFNEGSTIFYHYFDWFKYRFTLNFMAVYIVTKQLQRNLNSLSAVENIIQIFREMRWIALLSVGTKGLWPLTPSDRRHLKPAGLCSGW